MNLGLLLRKFRISFEMSLIDAAAQIGIPALSTPPREGLQGG